MKQRWPIYTLLLLTLLAVSAQPAPPQPPTLDTTGLAAVRVVDCLDGGRLTVDVGGRQATVHLLGIKATDPGDRAPSLAQNGAAAKTLLASLAAGEQVYLDPNTPRSPGNVGPRWPDTDSKGILLAHVWRVRDGLLLNAELLKQGVVFYASADQPRDEYLRYYSWCQRQANDAHIGLWSTEQLVAAGLPDEPAHLAPGKVGGSMPSIALPGEALPEPLPSDVPLEYSGGADPAVDLPTGISLESATARVTKRSRANWDLAWIVDLRNDNRRRLRLDLTVRFLDSDGYVVGESSARNVSVVAHGTHEAKGVHRMGASAAGKVATVSVVVKRAR